MLPRIPVRLVQDTECVPYGMAASAAAFKWHYALVHLVSRFVVIEEGRVLSIRH